MKITGLGGMLVALTMLAACGGSSGSGDAISAVPVTVPTTTAPVVTTPVVAPTPAMTLGTVTHFSQGWSTSVLTGARSLGVSTMRDEINWGDVEKSPGVYDFSSPRVSYPDTLLANGVKPILMFQGGNPNYDSGYTPYTDGGREAFARFIVKTLDRFPGVASIEIGNEYNSNDFVTGPVAASSYGDRQRYYAQMLKAVYNAVKASHASVRVLGGAAHSIPVGYLKTLFTEGALDSMDAIVVHPYTTVPEDLVKQLDILKTAMGSKQKPIIVTEFLTEIDSARNTASYLVKAASQLAVAGVAEADWYALSQEGTPDNIWYKNAGLLTFSGQLTETGQAFQMVTQRLLAQGAARRIPVDDFTFAIQFGDKAMVIWGEPRSLSVQGSMHFYDVAGKEIAAPTSISAEEPVVIVGDQALTIGGNVTLGPIKLIADSLTQFNYANDQSGRWSYWFDRAAAGTIEPTLPQGGGEVQSSNWTPYLGSDGLRPFAIASTTLVPIDFGTASAPNVFKPVLRYTAATSGTVSITGDFTVADTSVDGVDLSVLVNGKIISSNVFKGRYSLLLNGVALNSGDKLDFIVGTNKTGAGGDATLYRIKIFQP